MSAFESKLAPRIEEFLDYREALGYSTKNYFSALANLGRFAASNYPDCDRLTKELVTEWLESQWGDIGHKASYIRLFGEYLNSVGADAYVLPRRMAGVPNRKISKPYLFSADELRRLFSAIDSFPRSRGEPFLGKILPVMLRLTYACGLRPNESRDLETEDINLDTGEILIKNTKRKKERLVVMSEDILKMCVRYAAERPFFNLGSKYFFPSWNGEAFAGKYLHKCFTECWRNANPAVPLNLLPDVRIYNLRHLFATTVLVRWLEAGADIKAKLPYLCAYMGHSTFDETLYYVHLLPESYVSAAGIGWDELAAIVPGDVQ